MSTTIARERARTGAAFLDRVRPGWDQAVNLTNLQLSSPRHCVLGQVFDSAARSHPYAADGFDFAISRFDELDGDGIEYGFDHESTTTFSQGMPIITHAVTYQELDDAWAELIEARAEQRTAYETYAENIAFSEGYEDGYFDGQRSMLDAPKIETVSDITARFPIAG